MGRVYRCALAGALLGLLAISASAYDDGAYYGQYDDGCRAPYDCGPAYHGGGYSAPCACCPPQVCHHCGHQTSCCNSFCLPYWCPLDALKSLLGIFCDPPVTCSWNRMCRPMCGCGHGGCGYGGCGYGPDCGYPYGPGGPTHADPDHGGPAPEPRAIVAPPPPPASGASYRFPWADHSTLRTAPRSHIPPHRCLVDGHPSPEPDPAVRPAEYWRYNKAPRRLPMPRAPRR